MKDYIFLAGRVLYSLLLVIMGSNHFTQFSNMVAYASSKGIPAPEVSVIVTGLMIVLGSISILVGYRGKFGAWLVTLFLFGTSFFMHRFWALEDPASMQMTMINFCKDLALAGAALMLTQTGTGPYSVDNLKKASA
ncbi:MAG: DoxX family protein [candidate division KSB1 bacterium]|nr:DoxX family protein [candidate division KSB1 bacterium]